MAIIGSYRGCDSCYKWKKKCDTTQPGQPCSRCRTRNLPCTGAGQQRLKFKNQSSATRTGVQPETTIQFKEAATQSLCRPKWQPPCNTNDKTANLLVYFLDSTHPSYSLFAFRPALFREIPKRAGFSAPLDSSVATFTSLVESQKSPFDPPNTKSLQLYTSSLKALQNALSDPITRYDNNTLCAANILAHCHVWMAQNTTISRGHSEGLAYLISVAIQKDLKDSFLYSVVSGITVLLLEDSVFNPNIQLSPWIQELYPRQQSPSGVQSAPGLPACELKVFAMLPYLIKLPKENKGRIQWTYNYVLERYMQLRRILSADEGLSTKTSDAITCNERHGSFLAIVIILNAFLRGFYPSNMRLVSEREIFCADAIILGEKAKIERPLSAHHVPQAIVSAWCVVEDSTAKGKLQKLKLRQLIEDYRDTYAMARMAQHVAYWRAAPEKLRSISWFKACYAKDENPNRNNPNAEGKAKVVATSLDEFCCIL